jgi:hypothetical protein
MRVIILPLLLMVKFPNSEENAKVKLRDSINKIATKMAEYTFSLFNPITQPFILNSKFCIATLILFQPFSKIKK